MAKLLNIFLILTCCLSAYHGELSAQMSNPVSATGHIFAEVITVFTAAERSQMNFGRFSPGAEGGEIILTPESGVSTLGSIYVSSGSAISGSFEVSGDENAVFSVSLPSSPEILTHTASARTMEVSDWTSNPLQGIGTGRLQNGSQIVYVGATLKVGTINDNPVGVYTGSYKITFEFN